MPLDILLPHSTCSHNTKATLYSCIVVVMIVQLPCLQSPVWLLHFHSVLGLPIQSASLVLIRYHKRKTGNAVQLQLPFSKDIRKIWTATALPVGVILIWMLTSYFIWPTFLHCWLVLVRITLKVGFIVCALKKCRFLNCCSWIWLRKNVALSLLLEFWRRNLELKVWLTYDLTWPIRHVSIRVFVFLKSAESLVSDSRTIASSPRWDFPRNKKKSCMLLSLALL